MTTTDTKCILIVLSADARIDGIYHKKLIVDADPRDSAASVRIVRDANEPIDYSEFEYMMLM
jgi:hypothetical protein